VLVVVAVIGRMPVPVVHVVKVAIVLHGLVAAVRPVLVLVVGVGQVGQRVLVIVLGVRGMGVTFVHVIDVAVPLHAGVPAAWTVPVAVMSVARVSVVIRGCHCSSRLC
jgi:hypothetical protein